MPVPGLLNIPVVLLLGYANSIQVRKTMKQLKANSFDGKVYIFSHYTNPATKEELCAEFPTVSWKEAGENMIYEQVCADGKIPPERVTFYLLPELLKESQAIVVWSAVDGPTFKEMFNQIRWWSKNRIPLVETKKFSYLDLDLLRQSQFKNSIIKGR